GEVVYMDACDVRGLSRKHGQNFKAPGFNQSKRDMVEIKIINMPVLNFNKINPTWRQYGLQLILCLHVIIGHTIHTKRPKYLPYQPWGT
ncbi:hypothetical protein ACJX0J_007654, partial [Zea mays]